MSSPYISFVVVSRNDNHGGDLTKRMQIFVTALITQCERHEIDSELIIVEWNPPSNKKSLEEELEWPQKRKFCKVRIIEVPRELHNTLESSESLPLFQMIGKNVGIQRSKGKFILGTNIDIIFPKQFFKLLQQKKLKKDILYRSERVDIERTIHINLERG